MLSLARAEKVQFWVAFGLEKSSKSSLLGRLAPNQSKLELGRSHFRNRPIESQKLATPMRMSSKCCPIAAWKLALHCDCAPHIDTMSCPVTNPGALGRCEQLKSTFNVHVQNDTFGRHPGMDPSTPGLQDTIRSKRGCVQYSQARAPTASLLEARIAHMGSN